MFVYRRLVVAAVLLAVVANFVVETRDAEEADSDRKAVRAVGQELIDEIRTSLIGAKVLARADTQWLQHLDLAAAPPIESSRLPRPATARPFGRDAMASERTGNALMFASPVRRVVMRSVHGRTHRIQLYRLVAYYLTVSGAGSSPGTPGHLNFVRYVSVPVVDADQIDAISDPRERARILRHVAGSPGERAVMWACRRHGRAAGVYRIDPEAGELRDDALLPADPAHSEVALLAADRMSVATSSARSAAGFTSLARRSEDRGGFPHGFEAQLSNATTQQVMVHLTLVTRHSSAPVTVDVRGIALVREI